MPGDRAEKRGSSALTAAEQRTLAAFCEAMAPGYDGLPAAQRDVDVVAPVARFLATLPPRTRSRIGIALRIFDWLPFPRRFSRLDPAARQRFLRKLERSRFAARRDMLGMAKLFYSASYGSLPEVRERVGYEVSCGLADGSQPEPAASLGELEPQGEGEECDVVIVGSGAGGAPAASLLAESGLDVLVLEAGGHFTRDTYPRGAIDASIAMRSGATVTEGKPPVTVIAAHAVGGSTVINSGTCFRAPESVLRRWRDEFGIGWATDLDREFAEAEELMRVMPIDPERMGRNGQLAMEGARALGASGGPISRNAGSCVQCSSCPFGCAIDARRSMHVSYLPRAVAAGAGVRGHVEAERILVEDGRAVGVGCRASGNQDGTSRPFTVRARRAVIVACGALGTPQLLLRSELGGGQVGRNLHLHPGAGVGALYEEEVRGWEGVMQSYYVDEWKSRGILLEATFPPLPYAAGWLPGVGLEHQQAMLGFGHIGSIGVQLSDKSAGCVRLGRNGRARVSYQLSGEDAQRLHFGLARAAEVHFAAGAVEAYANLGGVKVLKPDQLADFEAADAKPADLRPEAFHPMGTARIAADPAAGVCSPDGAVNGVDGLYVADASLFPSSVAVNPMMTVIAFSLRVAKQLASGL